MKSSPSSLEVREGSVETAPQLQYQNAATNTSAATYRPETTHWAAGQDHVPAHSFPDYQSWPVYPPLASNGKYPDQIVLKDDEDGDNTGPSQIARYHPETRYSTAQISAGGSSLPLQRWFTEFCLAERLLLGQRRYQYYEQEREIYSVTIHGSGSDEERTYASTTLPTSQTSNINQEASLKMSNDFFPEQNFNYAEGDLSATLDESRRVRRSHSNVSSDMADDVSLDGEEVEEILDENFSQPPGEHSINRIANSKKYFDELEALEGRVYAESAIEFYKTSKNYGPWVEGGDTVVSKIPLSEHYEGKLMADPDIISLCQAAIRRSNAPVALCLWNLLECRNLLSRILSSCIELQQNGFCDDSISLLVVYSRRPGSVKLRSIPIESMLDLLDHFEHTILEIRAQHILDDNSFSRVTARLTADCELFLANIGLLGLSFPLGIEPQIMWRTAVHTLDLAILSYAGAHIEPFDSRYLGSQRDTFHIPAPFLVEPGIHAEALMPIRLSRRRLQCLDKFLGGQKVWVFSTSETYNKDNERLHLITEVNTFADIWGPLWKECPAEVPEQVIRYKVGHGYIVPWNQGQEITLLPGEVYCHWCAEDDALKDISFEKMKKFDGTETLVIGAPHVRLNRDCRCSNQRIKHRLLESNLIRPLSTSDPTRFIDGETMEIAVGIPAKGATGKYGRTWKRREGHPLRLALLESWEHPELNCLDPAELEHKYGLELSLSTWNARKVPLVKLLGSPSMLQYLHPYPWLDGNCKIGFINAVRDKDLKAFRQFWLNSPQWQDDVRKAVCCCLRALSETGFGIKEELDALYVIWVPALGQRHLVVLKESLIEWAGFLKDTRDYFTMAVATGECLDFTVDDGKCCGSDGFSVFETSLVINDSIKPSNLRKMRMKREGGLSELCWSASQLKPGESLSLGDRGALDFIRRVGKGSVLVKWKSAKLQQVKAQVEKNLLGRSHQRHYEHIEYDEELDFPENSTNGNGSVL